MGVCVCMCERECVCTLTNWIAQIVYIYGGLDLG